MKPHFNLGDISPVPETSPATETAHQLWLRRPRTAADADSFNDDSGGS